MAISSNTLFTIARKSFLEGKIDWLNDNIRVMLLRDTNALTEASETLASVPPEHRATPGILLTNTSTEGGAADGNDVTAQFAVTAENGTLVIEPRTVELRSASAFRTYDGGVLHTQDEAGEGVTILGDGFADGDGMWVYDLSDGSSRFFPGTPPESPRPVRKHSFS